MKKFCFLLAAVCNFQSFCCFIPSSRIFEYFGKDGLIVFPTLTWKFGFSFNDQGEYICDEVGNDEYKPYGNRFDVRNTDCRELGILPELFRRREGVIRSLSATHSVAAFGKDANGVV